jgi:predicted RNase H-like HicB family nuclease
MRIEGRKTMNNGKIKFIYWQDGDFFLGYLEEYPDYVTQGESLEDLKEHLKDIYKDISDEKIPNIRKAAELELS